MDIHDIHKLQGQHAAIMLTLCQEKVRNVFDIWSLYATFEILGSNGVKIVPAKVLVLQERHSFMITTRLDMLGLSYIIKRLADTVPRSELSRSDSAVRCQRTCSICAKTNFDQSIGCSNPSVFTNAVGDWICNLSHALGESA